MGLNFKLDIGLYRLDQQVACQRYRQTKLDAESSDRKATIADLMESFGNAFAPKQAAVLV